MNFHHDPNKIVEAVVELGGLAMAFGRINRTGPQHPTGEPESDTDHTVMLTWIAPALASVINEREGYAKHSLNRVVMYAAVHDAVEVYAGDTPTVKITEEELAQKEARERTAALRLWDQFIFTLPWFARAVRAYEVQADADARLVRSVDKLMPKVVHVLCAGQDLIRSGFTKDDFDGVVARQRKQVVEWSGDSLLLAVYDLLCEKVRNDWPSPASVSQPHRLVVKDGKPLLRGHIPDCLIKCSVQDVFDKWVKWNTLPLNDGEYPVDVNADGSLTFVGKQE